MDTALMTTIVSTSGPLIISVCGVFIMVHQVGRRIDRLRVDLSKSCSEVGVFKNDIDKGQDQS